MSFIVQNPRENEEKLPFKLRAENTGNISGTRDLMKCMVLNTQSICNKCDQVMEHVIDNDTEVMFLSETWLKSKKNEITAEVKTYGYELHHNPRKNRKKETGGGVGILVKNTMDVKPVKVNQFQSFEHCILKVCLSDKSMVSMVSIYRLDYEPIDLFFEEFAELLETLVASKDKFLIAGDINIHCDNKTDGPTLQLMELLEMFNLTQVISESTHRKGHTIDVVITQMEEIEVSGVEVCDVSLSDHYLISFDANCKTVKSYYRSITYRNIKQVNKEAFKSELMDALGTIPLDNDVGTVVADYNNKLSKLMDEHAPQITRKVKIVPTAPWFDAEYKEVRKQRRKAEKRYKITKNPTEYEEFITLRKQTTLMAKSKKQQYFIDKIESAKDSQKSLHKVVKNLLDVKQESSLPSAKTDDELADNFQTYFKDKIMKIRESFTITNIDLTPRERDPNLILMDKFDPVTQDELLAIISSYGISCSPEDPVHVALLSSNIEVMVPFWLELVNLSLSTGSMECLKSAVVTPLLKELDDFVDKEVYKNYRPVSNLVFVSKLTERCVAPRLGKHMEDNDLETPEHHGYKAGHSSETLLVELVDKLLTAFDGKYAVVLLLLDLSAAFDTVDQDKLLQILQDEIGVTGIALKWFESFLKGRTQKVKINNSYSRDEPLEYGVAQGSVLGPKLFNIYVRSFIKCVNAVMFDVLGFADDHQLFKQFVPICQTQVLGTAVKECLRRISKWMNKFFLRLNQGKTKILVLAPPSVMSCIDIHGSHTDSGCIRFVTSAKNLGVWLDQLLTFKTQVSKVASSCFLSIRDIAKIKSFLPREILCTLVSARVLSILDYCNSLYYKIGGKEIKKLQSVQNAAVRLVFGKQKFDRTSLTPLFRQVHWLPVKERIVFKVLLIVHKCVWGVAPDSLKRLIVTSNSRTLHLVEKRSVTAYGDRAFSCAGPKLWNCLPLNIREEKNVDNFKKLLKSYLMIHSNRFFNLVNMR